MSNAHGMAIIVLLGLILAVLLFGGSAVLRGLGWLTSAVAIIAVIALVAFYAVAIFMKLLDELETQRLNGTLYSSIMSNGSQY